MTFSLRQLFVGMTAVAMLSFLAFLPLTHEFFRIVGVCVNVVQSEISWQLKH